MKNVARIAFSSLLGLALVAGVSAQSQNNPDRQQPSTQSQSQSQTVSGKIASVAKDSFTLNVGGTASQLQQPSTNENQPTTAPKTMTFLIDKNTTVDGQLKVNSMADVTYREENGANVAISVHVTP